MAGTRNDEVAAEMWAAYQDGATMNEVAAQFGRARATVQAAFKRRGWHARPPRPADLEGRRTRVAQNHASRRAQLNAIKLAAGCIDCGFKGHPAALQFDHRDAALKTAGLASNISRSWDWVLAEIAKCDVRCANCHAVKTAERGYTGGRPRKAT